MQNNENDIPDLREARERLGSNEYEKRIGLLRQEWTVEDQVKADAAARAKREAALALIEQRRMAALHLADAVEAAQRATHALETATEAALRVSARAAAKALHSLPVKLGELDPAGFRREIEAAHAVLLEGIQ